MGSKTFQNEASKTNKRASVTVNVTCEQESREPLVAQTRSHVTLAVTLARLLVLRYSSRVFEEKRDCSQSIPTFSKLSYWEFLFHLTFPLEIPQFSVERFAFRTSTSGLFSTPELFSKNQFPDYLGTFPIHLSQLRNFRNFCLDVRLFYNSDIRDRWKAREIT